ncbi:MAG: hypothetical protein ACYTBX_01015 [Planctomycetota bacterium]|jgi:hypothetical protein
MPMAQVWASVAIISPPNLRLTMDETRDEIHYVPLPLCAYPETIYDLLFAICY